MASSACCVVTKRCLCVVDPAISFSGNELAGSRSVAAISVGLVDETVLLDLDYSEDKDADVDLNLVMTGSGQLIEVQGSGEEATFSRGQLDKLLKLGELGIQSITSAQRQALGRYWPLSD